MGHRLPAVSVIIPTKNEELNIARCLKSIGKQTYKGRIEVIVIDNFSDDQTAEIAQRYAEKVILAGPERSVQRNIGAKKATGKWLLFIDADMQLKPSAIENCISLVYPSPSIVALKELSVGQTFWGKALALEKNCYQDATYLIAARLFPKSDFIKLGGYDPRMFAAEDWDITQRLLQKGYRLLVTKKPAVIHYEPTYSLLTLLKKELYYVSNIHNYSKKQRKAFEKQSDPGYRLSIWFKNWHNLLSQPLLTAAFVFYKLIVWLLWLFHTQKKVSGLFSQSKTAS